MMLGISKARAVEVKSTSAKMPSRVSHPVAEPIASAVAASACTHSQVRAITLRS